MAIRYSCTALKAGKQGILRPDSEGYYHLPIGGLNVINSAGEYYVFEEAKALFEESGILKRRIQKGVLRGEVGHPIPSPGQTKDEFTYRVMKVVEANTCVQYADVYLDFDKVCNPDTGAPIVAIMGRLTPSGVHGDMLDKQLKNKHENVCFSIRAFTQDRVIRGVNHRCLKNIITWDYVNEPGIASSNKYNAPALEEYRDTSFEVSMQDVLNVQKYASEMMQGISHEDVEISCASLLDLLGVENDNNRLPAYMRTDW